MAHKKKGRNVCISESFSLKEAEGSGYALSELRI